MAFVVGVVVGAVAYKFGGKYIEAAVAAAVAFVKGLSNRGA